MKLHDRFERAAAGAEVGHLLDGEARILDLPERDGLLEANDALAVREWQVLEQDAVNDAEDGRVRADPQREREDGDGGVRGGATERPHRIS